MRWTFRACAMVVLACGFLGIGLGEGCQSHDDAFSKEGLLTASAEQLSGTHVTPHLQERIRGGENLLWCGSFQLAWNELCELTGGEVKYRGEQPEMATVLNRKEFTGRDLDKESYVALAGYVRDGIYGKIKQALDERFGGRASPNLGASRGPAIRPQDIVAYAYLFKNLEFPTPFEKIHEPLLFEKTRVECFGMDLFKPGQTAMLAQVLIWDYQDEDNFVIELKNKSSDDRIILAKIPPGQTLGQTVKTVQQRMSDKQSQTALAGDTLLVPKMNFDLTREYKELYGKKLQPTVAGMADDLQVLEAVQNIRLQMNEKGVKLKSESHIRIGCSAPPMPPPPRHILIFNKPFLMMLCRREAQQPYFAMWVGNAGLLVGAD